MNPNMPEQQSTSKTMFKQSQTNPFQFSKPKNIHVPRYERVGVRASLPPTYRTKISVSTVL